MRNNYLSTRRLSAMVMIACCFVCFGCEDFLTRDVPNQTTEAEWWQTRGQLQTALNNIYKVMPSGTLVYDNQSIEYGQGYGYPNQRVEQEALTDNGIASANYVTYDVFDAGAVPGTDRSVMYIWRIKWKAIRLACRYLKYYTQAKMTPDPSPHEGIQTVDRWAAEARACRAFYHMELRLGGEMDHERILRGIAQPTPGPREPLRGLALDQRSLLRVDVIRLSLRRRLG